jgi:hypothetical protein
MLVPDLMSEVTRLIPSHGGVFFWLDPNLQSFTNAYSTFPPSIIELYLREFHGTPRERNYSPPSGRILLDTVTAESPTGEG